MGGGGYVAKGLMGNHFLLLLFFLLQRNKVLYYIPVYHKGNGGVCDENLHEKSFLPFAFFFLFVAA